jgi:clan AA aspartic protease (TIGR02281 family)
MYRSLSQISRYCWLGICLAIATTACNSKNTEPQAAAPQPLPASTPSVQPSPQPVAQNDGEVYQEALAKADAANAIGQSAPSKDDWFLVTQRLEESVQMLKSIAPTSSQYVLAAKVLPKYEQQLATARQKTASFVNKSPQTTASASSSQVASVAAPDNSFSIPIQQKLGGVPVIEVTLNNTKVLMLLDTGASHTLITQAVADRMQLQSNGNSQAKTANGLATFQVTTLDKIKFGEGEIRDIRVSIGQKDLPYGLLGHDVYGNYDITIKESSIEFRKR